MRSTGGEPPAATGRPGRGRHGRHHPGRVAILAVLAAEAWAVATGRLGAGTGALVLVAVEGLLAVTALALAARRGRAASESGLDRLQAALDELMPSALSRMVTIEVRLARAALLGLAGRTDRVDRDDVAIPFAAGRRLVPLVFLGLALTETVVVDLVVPWSRLGGLESLRWVVLALSAYAALWILEWLLAERARPHLASREALVLRSGPVDLARIPWSEVRSVNGHERLTRDGDPTRLSLDAPMQPTSIDLELETPVRVVGLLGRARTYERVSLAADDPAAALAVIAERALAAQRTTSS